MKKLLILLLLIPAVASSDSIDIDSDGLNDIIVSEEGNSGLNFSAYLSSTGFTQKQTLATDFGSKKQTAVAATWNQNTFIPATFISAKKKNILRVEGLSKLDLGKKNLGAAMGFDMDPSTAAADIINFDLKGNVGLYQNYGYGTTNFTSLKFTKVNVKNGFPVVFSGLRATRNFLGFVRASGKKARKRYKLTAKDLDGNSFKANLGTFRGTLRGVFNYNLGSEDGFLLQIRKGNKTHLRLITRAGAQVRNFKVDRISNIAVANYSTISGDEALVKIGTDHMVINVLNNVTGNVAITGDVVGEDFTALPAGGSTSAPTGGNSSLSAACSGGIRGVPGGVLWKPDSDVSDNRGGKPVVLFQGGNKPRSNSIDIFAVNGTKICNFTFKAPNEAGINGNSDHYYSGWTGGCSKTGGQIQSLARAAAGSTNVYFSGANKTCFGPVNPDGRSGSIG